MTTPRLQPERAAEADDSLPASGSAVGCDDLLGACVEFIKLKLADAEKSLDARVEMRRAWASGTDESWRAAECYLSKAERLKLSDRHARIEIKCRREVEMFKAVLDHLQ